MNRTCRVAGLAVLAVIVALCLTVGAASNAYAQAAPASQDYYLKTIPQLD